MSTTRYSIILRPEPEGGFTVRVPAFPEIVTHGVDEADALAMAKEAIELVIESRQERGEAIPGSDAPLYREVAVSRRRGMSKLPAVKGDNVVRALKRGGFEVVRVKGSHHRLVHSADPRRATTVAVHAGRIVPKGTLRDIID